jgi:hypothetical protein
MIPTKVRGFSPAETVPSPILRTPSPARKGEWAGLWGGDRRHGGVKIRPSDRPYETLPCRRVLGQYQKCIKAEG